MQERTLTQRELFSVFHPKPEPTTEDERIDRWCDWSSPDLADTFVLAQTDSLLESTFEFNRA